MEIRDLIVYLFFMAMLVTFTLGVYTKNSFHLHSALAKNFINQHYYCEDERTDFLNVSSTDELWCYLKERFIVTLNSQPFWGGRGTTNETFLLREPRLRQVRVIKETCIVPVTKRGCFGEFSARTEEKSSFNLANDTAWIYNPPEEMGDIWFKGTVSYYNSAGYYFTLADASQLSFYKEHDWIDERTRAVFVDFTLYNINTNLFCVCQIMFELPSSGGIIPSYLFSAVKFIRYNDHYDHIIMACEIVFAVFCIYYTVELFYEILYFKNRFWKQLDNWIDSLVLALSWASVSVLIYRYMASTSLFNRDKMRGIQGLPDYQRLKYVHLTTDRTTAVTLFCSFLKLFRFIHFDTIYQLFTTLRYCFNDMARFSFLFFIVLFAYAELGTLLFSNFVESYRTIEESFFTLLRIMMGEFDYQEISRIHSFIGPLYIVSFVMFVVFLLLNMFLAIINATYSVVSSNVKITRRSEYLPFVKHCLCIMSKRFRPRFIEKAQGMNNTEKIIQLMARSGFSELEIDTFLSRYTIDNDREIPDEVFQRVVHQNVGMDQIEELRSRAKLIHLSVQHALRKKEFFLDKVGLLIRR